MVTEIIHEIGVPANIKGTPTNSKFITMIADHLSLRQKQGIL